MRLYYPKFLDTMDVTINIVDINDPTNAQGEENTILTYTGKCRYEEKAWTKINKEGTEKVNGDRIFIGEDIAPDLNNLEGSVTIGNISKKIEYSRKLRNPDGSVNHIELGVI